MHSLVCAGCAKSLLDMKSSLLAGRLTTDGYFCGGHKCRIDVIVSVHSDKFLGDIGIVFHILSVSGDVDCKLVTVNLGIKVKSCKDVLNIFSRYLDTEYSVNLLDACL